MNKDSVLNSFENPFLPLLEVFNEPLFNWIIRKQQNPQERIRLPAIQTPWDLILHLSVVLESSLPYLETVYEEILPSVWVARGVRIHGTAALKGPLVLSEGVEIGEGVFLQGPVYLGGWVRLDRGVEVQSSILCEGVQVGASSIVLESILGKDVVLEDGVTTLTRREDPHSLSVEYPRGVFHPTGFHRLGSYICPGVRIQRGTRLKAGSFIPPPAPL